MRTEEMIRELTEAELDETSGAEPNLGGYSYCSYPREGLYAGGCPTAFEWGSNEDEFGK